MEAKRDKAGPTVVVKASQVTDLPGHCLNDGTKIGELLDISDTQGGNASIFYFHLGKHRVIKVQKSHSELAEEIYTMNRLH